MIYFDRVTLTYISDISRVISKLQLTIENRSFEMRHREVIMARWRD